MILSCSRRDVRPTYSGTRIGIRPYFLWAQHPYRLKAGLENDTRNGSKTILNRFYLFFEFTRNIAKGYTGHFFTVIIFLEMLELIIVSVTIILRWSECSPVLV